MKSDLVRFVRLSAIAASFVGCVAVPEGEPAQVDSANQGLWANASTEYWPDGEVEICFARRPGFLSQPWAEVSVIADHVRDLIEGNYESIPNSDLDFTGWEKCEDETDLGANPGELRIVIQLDKCCDGAGMVFRQREAGDTYPFEGGHGTGYSATYAPMVYLNDGYGVACSGGSPTGSRSCGELTSGEQAKWDTGALHEIGHALGFKHEFDHEDWDGVCDLAGTTEGQKSGIAFTAYDHASIMNATYCHWTTALSPLDELGLEIVYPGTFTHDIRLRQGSGFATAEGFVVREDAILIDEWRERGADEEAYSEAPSWYLPSQSPIETWELDAAPLDSPTLVEVEWTTMLGDDHSAARTVHASSDLHAAITFTML